jgi:dihydrofolate reductase
MFEPAWSKRTVEDDPGAPFFNDTTKYVVSATLTNPTWRNSKVVGPYDPDAIRSLKDEVDGDLYTSGSGTLVRAMLADGLVDELHLLVHPLTRGSGPRLFPEEAAPSDLSRPHPTREAITMAGANNRREQRLPDALHHRSGHGA